MSDFPYDGLSPVLLEARIRELEAANRGLVFENKAVHEQLRIVSEERDRLREAIKDALHWLPQVVSNMRVDLDKRGHVTPEGASEYLVYLDGVITALNTESSDE